PRVAAARQLPVEQVAQLVAEYTHRPLARLK
ncbi:potassium-transporting ATPase subunit C, partial [Salmonella enterica]